MIYISLLFKLSFIEKKVDWTGLDSNWTGLDSDWTGLDSDWTGLDSSPVKSIFWVESIWSPVESSGVHMDSGGDCKVLQMLVALNLSQFGFF